MGGLGLKPPFPKRLLSRKVELFPGRLHLVGPPEVGKSCLALHFLKYRYPRRDWVYIDLANPRYRSNWGEVKRASLAILDNWDGVLPSNLPPIPIFLISSPTLSTPPGFQRVELGGLDWDEFLLFYTHFHHLSSGEGLLQEYLRLGTLPGGISLDQFHWEKYQNWLLDRLATPREFLELMIGKIGSRISIYSLYQQLKRRIPIGKDTLYREVTRLVEEGVLFPISKWNSVKSPKKYFWYNPAFGKLGEGTRFHNLLANYLYLHRFRGREVYYREGLTFYLPDQQLGVIVTSFPAKRELENLLRRLERQPGIGEVEIWSYSTPLPVLSGVSIPYQLRPFSSLFTG